jgi:hypothetical protein
MPARSNYLINAFGCNEGTVAKNVAFGAERPLAPFWLLALALGFRLDQFSTWLSPGTGT